MPLVCITTVLAAMSPTRCQFSLRATTMISGTPFSFKVFESIFQLSMTLDSWLLKSIQFSASSPSEMAFNINNPRSFFPASAAPAPAHGAIPVRWAVPAYSGWRR